MSSDIMSFMAKHVIHISEAEAASNFADVLARVRAGAEIVIGDEACGRWPWFVPPSRMSGCFPNLFVWPKNMLLRPRSTGTSPAISKRRSTATVSR